MMISLALTIAQSASRSFNMQDEYYSELRLSTSDSNAIKAATAPKEQFCPYFLKCGACQLLNWTYDEQMVWKQNQVNAVFKEITPKQLSPIIRADQTLAYRHKNNMTYLQFKSDILAGYYTAASKDLVKINHCLIQDPKAEAILRNIPKLMKANRIEAYNPRQGTGLIKHVLVKTSASGDLMVVLVISQSLFHGRKNFVNALKTMHPEITTIIENINAKEGPYILGDTETILFGKGSIREKVLDHNFILGSSSFFQVHIPQAEKLFKYVIDGLDLKPTDTVLDAYCGVGVIGILLSHKVKKVVGIESNYEALGFAKQNAKLNDCTNIEFKYADANQYLQSSPFKFDVLIVDPPREGLQRVFIDALITHAPKTIVYISCNPITQARDIKGLLNHYRIGSMQPIDMFPHTVHVETVVLMSRKDK
jgi:23S rRNA (uracil1939-C5)-methyltransferase